MSSVEFTNGPRICVLTVSDVEEATHIDAEAPKALHRNNRSKVFIVNTLEIISGRKISCSMRELGHVSTADGGR
jgi:hypothetical protein